MASALVPFVVRPFSQEEFIDLGLKLRSNGTSEGWRRLTQKSKLEHFRSAYTAHPAAIAAVWIDLQRTPFVEDRINESILPAHLLLVYRWLGAYESEKDLNNTYGIPEKKIRELCRSVTFKLSCLKKLKVSF